MPVIAIRLKMSAWFRAALGLAFVIIASPVFAQPVDRIGVPGPLSIGGIEFALAWSAQPTARYYKQEYLPAGQALKTYTRMAMIEVIESGSSVKSALAAQVSKLNQRKRHDFMVNMDVVRNDKTGEALLDFVLGDRDASGQDFVEWNAYRYVPFGQGVMLVAVSLRAYGDDPIMEFLEDMRTRRPREIEAVAQFKVPTPTLKK